MKVTYRVQRPIDKYRIREYLETRWFDYYFDVPDTNLRYFKNGRFEYFTVAKSLIVRMEDNDGQLITDY